MTAGTRNDDYTKVILAAKTSTGDTACRRASTNTPASAPVQTAKRDSDEMHRSDLLLANSGDARSEAHPRVLARRRRDADTLEARLPRVWEDHGCQISA